MLLLPTRDCGNSTSVARGPSAPPSPSTPAAVGVYSDSWPPAHILGTGIQGPPARPGVVQHRSWRQGKSGVRVYSIVGEEWLPDNNSRSHSHSAHPEEARK